MSASCLARCAIGLLCLVVPRVALSRMGCPDADEPAVRGLARILGVRYLLHAGLQRSFGPSPRLDAGVELVHAVSMLPLTRLPRHRRTAELSAGLALGIALLDFSGVRR